jgi:predicted ATPase
MKIELENVGKINKAQIRLDGITVIAGENSTGKSTVGKMLFCVFKAFYRMEEHIQFEKVNTVRKTVTNYFFETFNRIPNGNGIFRLSKEVVESQDYKKNKQKIVDRMMGYYRRYMDFFGGGLKEEEVSAVADKINKFLYIEDEELVKRILKTNLEVEFGTKIGHLNFPEQKSHVRIEIKNHVIEFEASNNGEMDVRSFISLMKEIIYMDDPYVLDNLSGYDNHSYSNVLNHRNDLLDKLRSSKKEDSISVLEEVMTKKRLQKILDVFNNVCDGELSDDGNTVNYVYKTDKLQDGLEVVNLSTGMKNFVILKQLLLNGQIDENGIVILDEPEIHLHPEWQLKFAEIIVLIQKEFGIHILLNTHSPYFLNAIEVYADKYGIADKCSYYLTEGKGDRTEIEDVSENIERIYAKLARPLQDLENLRYRDGNTG